LTKKIYHFFIIAAVNSAAFFLYANEKPRSIFVQGKTEIIEINDLNSSRVITLSENYSINYDDLVCTGKGSRTELHHEDLIFRLGSMSVISWHSLNSVTLHSGSMLLCSSKTTSITVCSVEANATFQGSGTIIFETTDNGGFKFIPIEARGTLITSKGGLKAVKGGRMMLVMGQPSYYGDAYDIDLMLMIKTSGLLNAFPDPLPSFGRISLAIYSQELKLKGKYNALIGDATTKDNLQMWQFGDSNEEIKKKGFFNRFF
jgi:hypothetical protein